jgi:hypothetical protein
MSLSRLWIRTDIMINYWFMMDDLRYTNTQNGIVEGIIEKWWGPDHETLAEYTGADDWIFKQVK